jgi:hypothetical protein
MIKNIMDTLGNFIILIVASCVSTLCVSFLAYLATRRGPIILFLDTVGIVGSGVILITITMLPVGLVVGFASFMFWYNENKRLELETSRQASKVEYQIRLVELSQVSQVIEQLKPGHSLITNASHLQTYHALPVPAVEMLADNALAQVVDIPTLDIMAFVQSCHHCALFGATGSGKTTLALAMVDEMRMPWPDIELCVLDPKQDDEWPIPPITDVDEIATALTGIASQIKVAKNLKSKSVAPKVIMIDENDWLADKKVGLGTDYTSNLFFGLKVGRSKGYRFVVMGQSPLSQDNGLSQSTWNSTGRLVLGGEAMKYLNGSSFQWKNERKELLATLESGIRSGHRCGLAIPPESVPYVCRIPELSTIKAPTFKSSPLEIVAINEPNERQQDIIDFWNSADKPSKNDVCRKFESGPGGAQAERIRKELNGFTDRLYKPF